MQRAQPGIAFQLRGRIGRIRHLLECLTREVKPGVLNDAVDDFVTALRVRFESDDQMMTLAVRAAAMCPFQTQCDEERRAEVQLHQVLLVAEGDLTASPEPVDMLPRADFETGRRVAKAYMVQRVAQRLGSAVDREERPLQASPARTGAIAAYKMGARRGGPSQRPPADVGRNAGPTRGVWEDAQAQAQAQAIVESELAMWDRERFNVGDDLEKRREMEEIRSEWDHLAYMRAMQDQFPNVVEEMSCIFVMSVSTAPVESVLSHAGRVDALRRTRLSCEMHEAMTAAVVRPEDFAEAVHDIAEKWATGIPWDNGALEESETSCLDGLVLAHPDDGEELTGDEALQHHPSLDDAVRDEPTGENVALFPTVRGEDEAFPRLVPPVDV
jgi:hypothetical protein